MCISFWHFFMAIRDFKRSVREVKSNIIDMKSILNGTLSMSKQLEDVMSEFKNVTEFYSEESKNALRDQLCAAMSTTAHEAFCHRDFLKQFKLTFDVEVCRLIEDYDRRTSQPAVLDVIQHLKRTIKVWMRTYSDDKLKTGLLVELTLYMQKMFSKHISDGDMPLQEKDKSGKNTNKSNIKIFCEKQYVIETMENLLSDHFSRNITSSDCYSDRYSTLQDLVYRKRATRIRRFRQYLTSKIQIRKIGKFYKEEISLHVSVDLKKASKEIWYHEGLWREQCADMVAGLRALPRHRFVDVLEEENFIDLAHRLTNSKLKGLLPLTTQKSRDTNETTPLIDIKGMILPKFGEFFGVDLTQILDYLDENITKKDKASDHTGQGTPDSAGQTTEFYFLKENPGSSKDETDRNCPESSSSSFSGYSLLKQIPDCIDLTQLSGHINTDTIHAPRSIDLPEICSAECNTDSVSSTHLQNLNDNCNLSNENGILPSIHNFLHENDDLRTNFVTKLIDMLRTTNVGDLLTKENFVHHVQKSQLLHIPNDSNTNNHSTNQTASQGDVTAQIVGNHSSASDDRIIIDPQLVYDDIEKITRKVLQMVGRKSARYTMELLERSHVISNKILDFMSNMHALYMYDITEETCENIFAEKIIEIIAMDLKREELNVLKNLIFAFSNNRKNKMAFLKKLEEKVPEALVRQMKLVRGTKDPKEDKEDNDPNPPGPSTK